jgi:hypothetical protein
MLNNPKHLPYGYDGQPDWAYRAARFVAHAAARVALPAASAAAVLFSLARSLGLIDRHPAALAWIPTAAAQALGPGIGLLGIFLWQRLLWRLRLAHNAAEHSFSDVQWQTLPIRRWGAYVAAAPAVAAEELLAAMGLVELWRATYLGRLSLGNADEHDLGRRADWLARQLEMARERWEAENRRELIPHRKPAKGRGGAEPT